MKFQITDLVDPQVNILIIALSLKMEIVNLDSELLLKIVVYYMLPQHEETQEN